MAYRSSSGLAGGTGTTAAVPVPAGAASGDIAVVGIYIETTAAITAPDGTWTQKTDLTTGTPSTVGRLVVFWKRLTAADTGTWTFTFTSSFREAAAVLFSGRIQSGDPFDGTPGTQESTGVAAVTVNAITTTVANDDLVGIATSFAGGTWTPASGLTERQDVGADVTVDTADAVTLGSTGNKTFTVTGSASGMKGFLGALLPATAVSGNLYTDPPDTYLDGASLFDPGSDDAGDPALGYLYQPPACQQLDTTAVETYSHGAESDGTDGSVSAGAKILPDPSTEAADASDRPQGTKVAAGATVSSAGAQARTVTVKVGQATSTSSVTAADRIASQRVQPGAATQDQATATDQPVGFKVAKGATLSSAGASVRTATLKAGVSTTVSSADASTRSTGTKTGTTGATRSQATATDALAGKKVTTGPSVSAADDATRSAGAKLTSGASVTQATTNDMPVKVTGIAHPARSDADASSYAAGFRIARGSTTSSAGARTSTAVAKAATGTVASTADGSTRATVRKAGVGASVLTAFDQTRTTGMKAGINSARLTAFDQTRTTGATLRAGVSRSAALAADVVTSARFVAVTSHSYAQGPYATGWTVGPSASPYMSGPSSTHWGTGPRARPWPSGGPYATDIEGGP